MIQTAFANQKQFIAHAPNVPQALQVSEAVANQSTEVTNSVIRSVGISSQLGITALDAAREHVNIYKRTVDAVADFNNNILKAWTSCLEFTATTPTTILQGHSPVFLLYIFICNWL